MFDQYLILLKLMQNGIVDVEENSKMCDELFFRLRMTLKTICSTYVLKVNFPLIPEHLSGSINNNLKKVKSNATNLDRTGDL